MAQHNTIGKLGEEIARAYLEKNGYKIVEQNWRTKRGEIDIIVKKGDVLVFVEVRTKVGEQFGSPEDTLTHEKKRRLLWNAKAYVANKKYKGLYRVDALCIVLKGDGTEIPQRLSYHESIVETP
ncbi:MAG: putative endonuclease [Parcubacteria group bacterium Greene1014_47]|nr:MAG: putative endonuclease [Parcubacteria group bacterium Greene1014_47]